MKRMGRKHRPFFRICAMDARAPRDGRTIEELGTYDPLVPDVDARVVLKADRIDYWLSVGAIPTEKVKVLIKKYGSQGTHRQENQEALQRLRQQRRKQLPESIGVPIAAQRGKSGAAVPAAQAEADEG
jgi:small subunit ribosomal protein S16